ncbi:MAG: VanZ family protein [Clostridia bacterium]|nr:VanZ family protein [Clostridia bacterium]
MKNHIIRVISALIALAILFMIFGFSAQNGASSGSLSRAITLWVMGIVCPDQLDNAATVTFLHHIIRKLAHVTEFALLGASFCMFVSTFRLRKRWRFLIALGGGVLVASSDEIHQLFVRGRGGSATDVLVDTIGIVIGAGLVTLIVLWAENRRKRITKTM